MEEHWLTAAKRLQAIASTGLYFTEDEFDRERYREVAAIANQLLARLADATVERIEGLVTDFAKGYATPMIDVRGAVLRDDRVLLVRERNGLWSLPGGFAEVGSSPAENVEKEVHEEAGLRVTVKRLYCIRRKAKHSYNRDVRDFYKLHFLCESGDAESPISGPDMIGADFFSWHDLPPLSHSRVIEADIAMAFAFREDPSAPSVFD